MKQNKKVVFTSFKSYGDFIILLTILRKFDVSYKVFATSHLLPLFKSMNSNINIVFFKINENYIPSIFNFKKDGFWKALISFIKIKLFLYKNLTKDDLLVFDKYSFREFFLSLFHKKIFISCSKFHNIYLDYENFINKKLIFLLQKKDLKNNIAIFPESRDKKKLLPAIFVKELVVYLESKNFFVSTIIVDELLLNKFSDCNVKLNNNSFDGLIKNIKENNVISADSLPSHIAEHFNIPNFVFVAKPNEYWMPYSCYTMHHWDIFGSFKYLNKWLDSIS